MVRLSEAFLKRLPDSGNARAPMASEAMAEHIFQTGLRDARGLMRPYRIPLSRLRRADLTFLASECWKGWIRHKASRLAASLAFYTLLSLAPFLLVAVFIGGLIVGDKVAEGKILEQVTGLIGPQGAGGLHAFLTGSRNVQHGVLATVISLVTLLFGASAVLLELKDALNTIWEVAPAETSELQGLIQIIKDRLVSFGLVLAVGFLSLISLVVNASIAAAGSFFAGVLPAPEFLLHAADLLLSFLVTPLLFAAIYKIMPDRPLQWMDVWLGSAVTSILFTVGRFCIGLYLGKATFASTYGAAASVVILIVWVYYSAQVFFLGAEFTRVFATTYGSRPAAAAAPNLVMGSSESSSGGPAGLPRIIPP